MINKFRKNSFKLGVWESGWNIFSKQFIEFLSIKRFSKITFKKFNLNKILKRKRILSEPGHYQRKKIKIN